MKKFLLLGMIIAFMVYVPNSFILQHPFLTLLAFEGGRHLLGLQKVNLFTSDSASAFPEPVRQLDTKTKS